MRFEASWIEKAVNAAPEERASVADLRIWLNDQNVTQHLSNDVLSDHVTVALYSLVNGLVYDWWTLFGRRDQELSFRDYRGGYLIPDVRLSFDGAVFQWRAVQSIFTDPDVRFWLGPTEIQDRVGAERDLDLLIKQTLDRLSSKSVVGSSAALRWARVLSSREDPDEAAFCEAASALGLDPYAMTDEGEAQLDAAAAHFDGEPLLEFLAGSAGTDSERLAGWIDEVEQRPARSSLLPELIPVAESARDLAPPLPDEQSWALGYRRAAAVRSVLDRKGISPFGSLKALGQAFGNHDFELAPNVDGILALRSNLNDGVHAHVRRLAPYDGLPTAHLFNMARTIGDATCFPEPTRAPINNLRSAYRQSASRAFAAEFLAPLDIVEELKAKGRDEQSIGEMLCVSPTVVERQLENAGRIRRALKQDKLQH